MVNASLQMAALEQNFVTDVIRGTVDGIVARARASRRAMETQPIDNFRYGTKPMSDIRTRSFGIRRDGARRRRTLAQRLTWPLIALLVGSLPTIAVALEVGEPAPDFELPASDGRTYRLSDFEGKSSVILAWFPRAFTSGCTIECKALAENGDRLRKYDVTYFMISVDPLAENTAFADSLDADFPLLSDATKEAARSYGVLYENRFALRYNFFIDEEGIIRAIDSNVDPQSVVEDMIETLERLDVPAP